MKPLSLLLSAALLVLASDAGAQSGNYPLTDSAAISTVQVTAQAPGYWLGADQAQAVKGYYEMSNGWRMKVNAASRYIDAAIDNQPPMRLIALSPDRFATRDGNVTMEFNRGDTGDDMLMSYVDPRLAQVVTISARMAQR